MSIMASVSPTTVRTMACPITFSIESPHYFSCESWMLFRNFYGPSTWRSSDEVNWTLSIASDRLEQMLLEPPTYLLQFSNSSCCCGKGTSWWYLFYFLISWLSLSENWWNNCSFPMMGRNLSTDSCKLQSSYVEQWWLLSVIFFPSRKVELSPWYFNR